MKHGGAGVLSSDSVIEGVAQRRNVDIKVAAVKNHWKSFFIAVKIYFFWHFSFDGASYIQGFTFKHCCISGIYRKYCGFHLFNRFLSAKQLKQDFAFVCKLEQSKYG